MGEHVTRSPENGILVFLRHGKSQFNIENRFTGWLDVPLAPEGFREAENAGRILRDSHIVFDRIFVSKLIRARQTLDAVLTYLTYDDPPIEESEALNERHYGALQGLNKAETSDKYGVEQVHIWRRSYDTPPPKDVTEFNPEGISESLRDTAHRTIPYYKEKILPLVKQGKRILIVAHGNSLRAITMELECLDRLRILELNIETGIPIVYEIDHEGLIVSKRMLA